MKYVWDSGAEELHDLATDEQEKVDLLVKMPAEAAKLRAKLAQWEKDVSAPRLKDFK